MHCHSVAEGLASVPLPEESPACSAGMPPPPNAAYPVSKKDATISGASTVVKIPRADTDKTVTALVPSSVRRGAVPGSMGPARPARPMASAVGMVPNEALRPAAGSSAIPVQKVPLPKGAGVFDSKYQDFMTEMADLGALAA